MALRVIIFYVLMWFFLLVLGGVQQETGIIPAEIGLPQWAPGLAGLLMLAIFKKDGLKLSWVSKDTPKIRYLLAVIVPLGVGLIVLLIKTLLNYPSGSGPNSDNLLLTILWAPLGALGEEIGWRGYLHKKLDTKMRGLISSILVGFLWMPMHVHYLSEGFPFILVFLFLIISYSIVVYSLVQDISFNVLAATLFHLTINSLLA